MGIFGKKKTLGSPLSSDEVRSRLLRLNRETSPYHIVDGQSEGVDLVAE